MDIAEHVDRKQLRFMGDGAAYAVLAMEQAIADSGLDDGDVSNVRSGLIAGSGGPSTANLLAAFDITREKDQNALDHIWYRAACHQPCQLVLPHFLRSVNQLFDFISLFNISALHYCWC